MKRGVFCQALVNLVNNLRELSQQMGGDEVNVAASYKANGSHIKIKITGITSEGYYKYVNWLKNIYLLSAQVKYMYGEILTLHLEKNKSNQEKIRIINELFSEFKEYATSIQAGLKNAIYKLKTEKGNDIDTFANPIGNVINNFNDYLVEAQILTMGLEDELPDLAKNEFKEHTGVEFSSTSEAYFTPSFLQNTLTNKRGSFTKKGKIKESTIELTVPVRNSMVQRFTKRVTKAIEDIKTSKSSASIREIQPDNFLLPASEININPINLSQQQQILLYLNLNFPFGGKLMPKLTFWTCKEDEIQLSLPISKFKSRHYYNLDTLTFNFALHNAKLNQSIQEETRYVVVKIPRESVQKILSMMRESQLRNFQFSAYHRLQKLCNFMQHSMDLANQNNSYLLKTDRIKIDNEIFFHPEAAFLNLIKTNIDFNLINIFESLLIYRDDSLPIPLKEFLKQLSFNQQGIQSSPSINESEKFVSDLTLHSRF